MWWEGYEYGGSSSSTGSWESDILAHRAVPTDVTIDIKAFRGGADLDIRAEVCVEPGGAGKDLRIYVVQILDHYLAVPIYHRNAFRQVKTEDVTIAAGACVDVRKTMALKDTDLLQIPDIGIVVWAQEPFDVWPAEVFQAAYVFDPPGITADGFESSDVSAWD